MQKTSRAMALAPQLGWRADYPRGVGAVLPCGGEGVAQSSIPGGKRRPAASCSPAPAMRRPETLTTSSTRPVSSSRRLPTSEHHENGAAAMRNSKRGYLQQQGTGLPVLRRALPEVSVTKWQTASDVA